MPRKRICLLTALLIVACSGTRQDDNSGLSRDQEKLINALTLFVESVQGDRFEKAVSFLTVEEKNKMTGIEGKVPPAVQKRLKALRLSTLATKAGVRLEKGKLEGIYAWLPNIDRMGLGTGSEPSRRGSSVPLFQ